MSEEERKFLEIVDLKKGFGIGDAHFVKKKRCDR